MFYKKVFDRIFTTCASLRRDINNYENKNRIYMNYIRDKIEKEHKEKIKVYVDQWYDIVMKRTGFFGTTWMTLLLNDKVIVISTRRSDESSIEFVARSNSIFDGKIKEINEIIEAKKPIKKKTKKIIKKK